MTLTSVYDSTKKRLLFTSSRVTVVRTACLLVLVVVMFVVTGTLQFGRILVDPMSTVVDGHSTTYSSTMNTNLHRKLLHTQATKVDQPNRIWGDKCSNTDIIINQGPTDPLPSGIPTYTVEIMNVCTTGCDISAIHLTCGWFSSARLINPQVFKRINYNDCLVNNGNCLANGHTVSFQYANTFRYPLSVSSVKC